MTAPEVASLIQTSGLAVVLLLGLLYGLYRLGRLAIEKCLVPMAEAHIEHVHELTALYQTLPDKIASACSYRHTGYEMSKTSINEH